MNGKDEAIQKLALFKDLLKNNKKSDFDLQFKTQFWKYFCLFWIKLSHIVQDCIWIFQSKDVLYILKMPQISIQAPKKNIYKIGFRTSLCRGLRSWISL